MRINEENIMAAKAKKVDAGVAEFLYVPLEFLTTGNEVHADFASSDLQDEVWKDGEEVLVYKFVKKATIIKKATVE